MVNLFIIRYLYSHLDKAECFMEKSLRKKSKNFYKLMNISSERMARILHGENFNLTINEKEKFCGMFHVKENFFMEKGAIMPIQSVNETDWKCFFHINYQVRFNVMPSEKEKKENTEYVVKNLKKLSKKGTIENNYDTESPIFRIWYYFKNGTPYNEESRLTRFLRELSNLSISDWDELEDNLSQMQRYGDLLEKHVTYIKAAITYKSMKQ